MSPVLSDLGQKCEVMLQREITGRFGLLAKDTAESTMPKTALLNTIYAAGS